MINHMKETPSYNLLEIENKVKGISSNDVAKEGMCRQRNQSYHHKKNMLATKLSISLEGAYCL